MKIIIIVLLIIALVVIIVGGWFLWLLGRMPDDGMGDRYWG
jgi:hypothetical protein